MPQLSLDLTDTRHQLVGVALTLVPSGTTLQLRLPAWTPGSYLIRDYVRTLEGLKIHQAGRCLHSRRLDVAHWQVDLADAAPVEVSYRIDASDSSVRTCQLTTDHGFLALAGVALAVEGQRWQPHQLRLTLPSGWRAFVPLPEDGNGGWIARDFDQLIDAPLEVGDHPCHCFEVAGVPHRWVTWGEDLPAHDPELLSDVEAICLACCRLMGDTTPPADAYLFLLHLLDQGYGGLEHDHSCVLQFGRRRLRDADGRRRLLQLVAHEYLHQWNVRRLRPRELTPIDYHRPMVVPSLWFAEGVTSYYDQLLPLLAGLTSPASYLEDLGADLSRYLKTPGRAVQSLRDSSEEAWVKLYRADRRSADSQISYYLKGAVLALVLDLWLRRRASSLATVLRDLWHSFGRHGRGYGEADLLAAFGRHDPELSVLLPQWLSCPEDPPLESLLAAAGLRLKAHPAVHPFTGLHGDGDSTTAPVLKRVERSSPGAQAGLLPGDEVVAVDGLRVPRLADLDWCWRAGRLQTVVFCRDGRLRQTELLPSSPAAERWDLEIDPQAGEEQTALRQRWLSVLP